MVTHGDFMLALMLTIEDLADEEFLHRADSDDWKITNCTCLHYTRRDPETGRTSKRVRWEQTARPVLDETTGRWEVKVEPWREFKRRISPMAIWWMWCRPSTHTCWSITANSLSRKRDFTKSS